MNKALFFLSIALGAFSVTCTWAMEHDAILEKGYIVNFHPIPQSVQQQQTHFNCVRQIDAGPRSRMDGSCRSERRPRIQPPMDQWIFM